MNKKEHWEKVFSSKRTDDVSWYQKNPKDSLSFFRELRIPLDASVIDVGGGDSLLVDHLLDLGYEHITVLDISEAAINRAKTRLGNAGIKVNWIVADILDLDLDVEFDCWHDRAAFHFLTTDTAINDYLAVANRHIKPGGKIIMGTFSTAGPEKCSGLPVKQYDENTLKNTLHGWFRKIRCITTDHITPFNTIQNFLFCSFQKLST